MARRRPVNDAAQMPLRTPAQQGGASAARDRWSEMASADCSTRVAAVLSRLGYGFDIIPPGGTALEPARVAVDPPGRGAHVSAR